MADYVVTMVALCPAPPTTLGWTAAEVLEVLLRAGDRVEPEPRIAANALALAADRAVDDGGVLFRGRWEQDRTTSVTTATPWRLPVAAPSAEDWSGPPIPAHRCGHEGSGPLRGPWRVR